MRTVIQREAEYPTSWKKWGIVQASAVDFPNVMFWKVCNHRKNSPKTYWNFFNTCTQCDIYGCSSEVSYQVVVHCQPRPAQWASIPWFSTVNFSISAKRIARKCWRRIQAERPDRSRTSGPKTASPKLPERLWDSAVHSWIINRHPGSSGFVRSWLSIFSIDRTGWSCSVSYRFLYILIFR